MICCIVNIILLEKVIELFYFSHSFFMDKSLTFCWKRYSL